MNQEEKQNILAELGGLSEDIYDELLKEHLEQTGVRCQEIDAALVAEDIDQAGHIAHSIKGASGNLRLHELYDKAKAVEQSAKNKEDVDSIRLKLDLLHRVTEKCKSDLLE